MGLGLLGMLFFGVWVPMRITREKELEREDETPPPAPVPSEPVPSRTPPIGLTRSEFISAVAMSVTLFLALLGPVWQRDYDVDRAVLLSYLAIPVLVAIFLRRARRLKLRAF